MPPVGSVGAASVVSTTDPYTEGDDASGWQGAQREDRYDRRHDADLGERASRTATLAPEHVKTYADLSGDYNPLHFDQTFARETPFGALVVQGGSTTGSPACAGCDVFRDRARSFSARTGSSPRPVFIGDTITAQAEVVSVHEAKPVCQLKINVTRKNGKVGVDGSGRLRMGWTTRSLDPVPQTPWSQRPATSSGPYLLPSH